MQKSPLFLFICLALSIVCLPPSDAAEGKRELKVLFIGNSYTARHNLAQTVKKMAEAGQPGLTLEPTQVIYGGRRPVDHWNLFTQNIVTQYKVTPEEIKKAITELEAVEEKSPLKKYATSAIGNQKTLLKNLENRREKWDVVVLQSYRDDLEGADSLYMQYAPKFAELAKAQGARVILYETTPSTQNAKPLTEAPDPAPILEKEKSIAALADEIGAEVAPMSMIALECQTERPDLPLRFVNDAHLNQTLSYLTGCAIYAALFDESPVGLPIDSVTDIRYFNDKDKTKDRDGNPIKKVFSDKDREQLQQIAWKGREKFLELRGK